MKTEPDDFDRRMAQQEAGRSKKAINRAFGAMAIGCFIVAVLFPPAFALLLLLFVVYGTLALTGRV